MFITTYFCRSNAPATGLAPIIRIRSVDTGVVVASGVMSEIGGGFYKSEFAEYDITEDYLVLCDAMTLPDQYRYKAMATGEYGDKINDIQLIADAVDVRVALIRQIMINRQELVDGSEENLVLYDDDSTTLLLKWDIKDVDSQEIVTQDFEPTKRSRGA